MDEELEMMLERSWGYMVGLTNGIWIIHAMKKHRSCFEVMSADAGKVLSKFFHDLPNMHIRQVEIRLPPE